MPRISSKHQITLPVSALAASGLRPGDEVHVEVVEDGELRVSRAAPDLSDAFGALTGVYPPNYLEQLDREDELRW